MQLISERQITLAADGFGLYSEGMGVCSNPADAEDNLQETLIRPARSLKKSPNT